MKLLIFCCCLLLPGLAAAQCYTDLRKDGKDKFTARRYAEAIEFWEAARGCSDKPATNDLDALIKKARTEIKRQDDAAAEKRRREQTAEAEKKRQDQERELVRQQDAARRADDEAWEMVKESTDPKVLQKYVDKYSAHEAEALQRIKELTPAPAPLKKPKEDKDDQKKPKPAHLVFIKGGSFQMGDLFGEGEANEKSIHTVTVSDLYMGKTEVTFDEYDAYCTATGAAKPSDSGWGRGRRPVINVDWYDAVEYCNWLSAKEKLTPAYHIHKKTKDPNNQTPSDTKKWTVTVNWTADGYRLPTEAEWEYAARQGGKKVRFGNGKDVATPSQMNFNATESYKKDYSVVGEYRQKTVPAASFEANSLGLFDMSGNVSEWCHDWYGADYYGQSKDTTNPGGPGSGQHRCVRGGSWNYDPNNCRASNRTGGYPGNRFRNFGFRVVRH